MMQVPGGVEGSILCLLVGQVLGSCYSGVGRDVDQHCRCPRRAVLRDDVPVNGVRVAGDR